MSRKASLIVLVLSLLAAGYLLAGVAFGRGGNRGSQPYREMGVYAEVLQKIQRDYVTKPSISLVTEGALHGLVQSLDADSAYLSPAEYRAYLDHLHHDGEATLGLIISKRYGYATVVDVQPGSPAAQAGLERGDFIEEIEGRGTRDLSMPAIHFLLSGAAGTPVTISVVKVHHTDPVKLTLKLARLAPSPLTAKLYGQAGYIGLRDLDAGRVRQIAAAIKTLSQEGAREYILDLRNCGAGDYGVAVRATNLFLSHGTITYLQGQTMPRETFAAKAAQTLTQLPLVVLVNAGTSGPAEVVAAALRDNDRGVLIGDPTYGEGSMQKVIPVGDGSAIILSVARYYAPNGHAIQKGVQPDIAQVRYAGALPDQDVPLEGSQGPQTDLQLQRALEYFHIPAKAAKASA